MSRIDRRALVARHNVTVTTPDARNPLTVGNGDFAYTADITGMQTFRAFHDPDVAMGQDRLAVNTCTMSTWGWHEMPNPDGHALDDAMTVYESARGPVSYADKYDIMSMYFGDIPEEFRAGAWLNINPQRLDLGRTGLELRDSPTGEIETDPDSLTDVVQTLDLWSGTITSSFRYRDEPVVVTTVASANQSAVAFRITSPLLEDGRLTIGFDFGYASDVFHQPNNWDAAERHSSTLETSGDGSALITRRLDATTYVVGSRSTAGTFSQVAAHHFRLTAIGADEVELVVEYAPTSDSTHEELTFQIVSDGAAEWWSRYWEEGGVVDLAGTADPRAAELERRIVLSQYLTAVNSSGVMPPQETGLTTNSWQGKAHLEMHWWHAAHFPLWSRPQLLRRSIDWYKSVLDGARAIAQRQKYEGARWPKQVGPDGRESPDNIGTLLIWQQPHLLYFAELLYRAEPSSTLVDEMAELVDETAAFMASFVVERDGVFHLPAPLGAAQEVYDAKTVEDPTFELGYWWWGLEIANRWRERRGLDRDSRFTRIQNNLAPAHTADGVYSAIATEPYLKREDHPSMIGVLGVLPSNPVADEETVVRTIQSVVNDWKWDSAWAWDFPVMAMAATRAGDPELAVDTLLMDAEKNRYQLNGHITQLGNIIPIYLPGNGGLLTAVALMVAGWDGSGDAPGLPNDWTVRHEGLNRLP